MAKEPKNLMRLNDRTIEGLVTSGKRVLYWDELVRGLMLLVYKDGSKAWTARPVVSTGKQKRVTLGHWCRRGGFRDKDCITTTEARMKFIELFVEARRGNLVPEEVRPVTEVGDSLQEVAKRYYAHQQKLIDGRRAGRKRQRTLTEEKRVVENEILPTVYEGRLLAEMPVQDIKPRHLVASLHPISARGALILRERAKAYLSNVFKHALLEGLIELNPVSGVQRMTKEKPRARQYSDAEVSKLWRLWMGLESVSDPAFARQAPQSPYFFCLALLTLARRNDLLHMEWKRITQEGGTWMWSIPTEVKMPDGSRVELIKNGIQHRVPLSGLAMKILKEQVQPLSGGERWVWPSPRKLGWPLGVTGVQLAKNRYQKEAGLEDFRLHDLKSIGATLLARLKVDEKVIGYLCNHKPRNITAKVYIREQERYFEERSTGLEMLAEHIVSIAEGRTAGKVLTFPA